MKKPYAALLACAVLSPAASFSWRQVEPGRWRLAEGDHAVLVYNAAVQKHPKAPADRNRCCYVYPLYSAGGTAFADDFPEDHYHHRGLFWAWPQVRIGGEVYDLWMMKGIRHEAVSASVDGPTLRAVNRWVVGSNAVVRETVELAALPAAAGEREIRLVLTLTATGQPVTLEGSPTPGRAYGGVSLRFAPRTRTWIDSSDGPVRRDEDLQPHTWASFTATYEGKTVRVTMTPDAANPAYPNVWCLRTYGFQGASWPGRQPATLAPGVPVRLAYRITIADLPPAAPVNRILIYTRNHVTNGNGYVHDNIAASVAAIRSIGAQQGFTADHSEDPEVFTDANLQQYRAIVFASSNNEAFSSDAQRAAFTRFIRSGGGVAGIHSATGSERKWPYFWSVMGGKFRRHPPLQTFTVRVADPHHPATQGLPATFEWSDEFYYHDEWAPGARVLLTGDPRSLSDPKGDGYPGDRYGGEMPLAWTRTFDGGRQFYVSLGHKIEHYSDPHLLRLLTGGILWAMGEGPK